MNNVSDRCGVVVGVLGMALACGGADPEMPSLTSGEAATGGEGPTSGASLPDVVGCGEHDVEIPGDLHVQGLTLRAKLFVPCFDGPVGPLSAMMVLHGSLFIEHGTDDSLIDDCSTTHGEGRRQLQSAMVATALNVKDRFHLTAHENAGHGFDNAEAGDSATDLIARDTALAQTLMRIASYLSP